MYRIVLKKPAKKFIDRLPLNEKRRIVAAIERLPNLKAKLSESCHNPDDSRM